MQLMELDTRMEAILFASGEPVSIQRLSAVLNATPEEIEASAQRIGDCFDSMGHGIQLVRLEEAYQLCSRADCADFVRLALETRKPPQLSPPALEVLSVVAYFQPVTKAYIEQVRGVDSSYTVGLLTERRLIEPCGRLAVPGRPVLYRTTPTFLRVFGISALDELPPLPDNESDVENKMKLQEAIERLQKETQEEPEPNGEEAEAEG